MSTDTTIFKHVEHIGTSDLVTQLENNLKYWLDWAFLKVGAWDNVAAGGAFDSGFDESFDIGPGTSGVFGGNFHNLRHVDDPAYSAGQVWQGIRKDWVWESGVNYVNGTGTYNPDEVEVFINTTGVATTGTYAHYIDYPNGEVVFDSPVATGNTVSANYSYRNIQVFRSDDAEWWQRMQWNSLRPDSLDWTDTEVERGNFGINAHHRVQLPAIVIEIVQGESSPYELGNSASWVKTDVVFRVFAENRFDRNKLVSILRSQTDRAIKLFNTDDVLNNNDYPLDWRGMLVGDKTYPHLISLYEWKKCWLSNPRVSELTRISPNLYAGSVRLSMTIVEGDLT